MPLDLFSRVRGAASLHYKGQDFWTQDVAALDIALKPFPIKSNAFGNIAKRQGGRLVTVTFTPVGVWTAAQLAVLFPYLNPRYGDYNTPVRSVTAVTYGAGTITVPNHGFITGTGVRIGGMKTSAWTLPTGLAANTTYYVIAVDANTISLADTEAHALANSNIVAMTDNGTGTFFVIQNSPLIITTVDGVQLTVWNAAVVDQPALSLAALVSTMKTVKFEGYTLHGQSWKDANSLFTLSGGVVGAVPPDQSQIPTVSYCIDWATRLPVTAIDDDANTLTIANHGLVTAQAVTLDTLSAGAALPSALAPNTTYYVIVSDANTIQLATSADNAAVPTAIALVSDGSGEINVVTANLVKGIEPREAIEVSFPVTWAEVSSGGDGLNCRSITMAEAKVAFTPTNVDLGTILNEMELQGGSAAMGQDLQAVNLDIHGPGQDPFIRVYGADLETPPVKFGSEADRIDKLQFSSVRTFRGPNQNPIAFVGVAAPTV
jgi:hypothetical protein